MNLPSPAWYSIAVTAAPEASEALEYAFNSLEALGTEINYLQNKNSESVIVVGYFNEAPDEEQVQDELHYALCAYGLTEDAIIQTERSKIEDTDWLAEWKKHWKPTTIGGLIVAPPWSDLKEETKIVIRIDPNMAFGTGTHETTQLCLRSIENNYGPGDSFLDVGTGTGILAIAAAKINLRSKISDLKSEISNFKLLACDTDADAIAIARGNAKLNDVGDAIEFLTGSITDDVPVFDFVCANLTLDVIKPLLPILLAKARKTLVLSGILAEQKAEIVGHLSELGILSPEILQAGEWISVLICRDPRKMPLL